MSLILCCVVNLCCLCDMDIHLDFLEQQQEECIEILKSSPREELTGFEQNMIYFYQIGRLSAYKEAIQQLKKMKNSDFVWQEESLHDYLSNYK